ncbi:hypothetical protein O9993_16940 [Vibrio lentus]|nr:hypothetical protein [Vibrio lentus]
MVMVALPYYLRVSGVSCMLAALLNSECAMQPLFSWWFLPSARGFKRKPVVYHQQFHIIALKKFYTMNNTVTFIAIFRA